MKDNNSSVLEDTKKTIAQQLKITEFPFIIRDKRDFLIYNESSSGHWYKYQRNKSGVIIHQEDSNGGWINRDLDSEGREIFYQNSKGILIKREFDSDGNVIYYETEKGVNFDKRTKFVELTLRQVAEKLNIDVNLLRIKE
jgi:hypothetical protein